MFRILSRPIALVPRIPRARGLVTLNNDLIQNLKSHKIIPDGKYRPAAAAPEQLICEPATSLLTYWYQFLTPLTL